MMRDGLTMLFEDCPFQDCGQAATIGYRYIDETDWSPVQTNQRLQVRITV